MKKPSRGRLFAAVLRYSFAASVSIGVLSGAACTDRGLTGQAPGAKSVATAAVPPRAVTLGAARDFDESRVGLTDCRGALHYGPDKVVAICHNATRDTKDNYGLRLHLVQGFGGEPKVTYVSPVGGGDAYSGNVTVFELGAPVNAGVLFLDYAAEFHYGTQIYFLPADGSPGLIGRNDWVVLDEDNQPKAPTAHLFLLPTENGFLVRFDRKLMKPKPDGSAGVERDVSFSYDIKKGKWIEHN